MEEEPQAEFYQNVVVMRHGDRLDNFDRSWTGNAARPWDPPLHKDGLDRAFHTGRTFINHLGFSFHRVFVSPFLRCVQTADQVIRALSAANPSILKVSIEYGLCEMLSNEAFRPNVAPKDENWGFDIPQLEAILPIGTVDHSIERVHKEMLPWEGSPEVTHRRYVQVFNTLADKYPSENLLLVTHGEAVGVAVSSFMEDVLVYGVEYCAFVHLRRAVFRRGDSFEFGKFEVKLGNDGEDGIKHMPKPVKE